MTRYSDADNKWLQYELFTYTRDTGIDEAPFESALNALDDAPTIDAVEVVRCKDCKYYHNHSWHNTCDRIAGFGFHDDWYCADGERKTE